MARKPARTDAAAVAAMVAADFRNAPAKDGLAWGLELHRWVEPRDWPQALERVPAEHRAVAEDYLRGIAARMRTLRNLARAAGFDDVDAWREAMRKALRPEA